jgi:hypothetical protein
MPTLTTPTFLLPYPDGDELVSDGDAAFAALALAIEVALNPPWNVISAAGFGANYSARAGYFAPAYRVFGDGRVQLRGGMSKTVAIVTNDVLFTLPTPARPSSAVSLPIAVTRSAANKTPTGKIEIATTGAVVVHVFDGDLPPSISLDGASYSKT